MAALRKMGLSLNLLPLEHQRVREAVALAADARDGPCSPATSPQARRPVTHVGGPGLEYFPLQDQVASRRSCCSTGRSSARPAPPTSCRMARALAEEWLRILKSFRGVQRGRGGNGALVAASGWPCPVPLLPGGRACLASGGPRPRRLLRRGQAESSRGCCEDRLHVVVLAQRLQIDGQGLAEEGSGLGAEPSANEVVREVVVAAGGIGSRGRTLQIFRWPGPCGEGSGLGVASREPSQFRDGCCSTRRCPDRASRPAAPARWPGTCGGGSTRAGPPAPAAVREAAVAGDGKGTSHISGLRPPPCGRGPRPRRISPAARQRPRGFRAGWPACALRKRKVSSATAGGRRRGSCCRWWRCSGGLARRLL